VHNPGEPSCYPCNGIITWGKGEVTMAVQVQNEVKNSLLQELNLVTRYYFHQSVDDIMNDLHCQSKCVEYSSQADVILKTIHNSGVLFQRSDKIITQVRDAVARYVRGTYGVCVRCGNTISKTQLVEAPTRSMCNTCIGENYSVVYERGLFH